MARLRLGLIGCGDVAFRHYLPALASQSGRIELVGVCDRRAEAAERLAGAAATWSPEVRTLDSLEDLLEAAEPQAPSST